MTERVVYSGSREGARLAATPVAIDSTPKIPQLLVLKITRPSGEVDYGTEPFMPEWVDKILSMIRNSSRKDYHWDFAPIEEAREARKAKLLAYEQEAEETGFPQ